MGGKFGQIVEKMTFVGNYSPRDFKTTFINLNAAKCFVESRSLTVARHEQNNKVAPTFRKPEPGRGSDQGASNLPAVIRLKDVDREDFTIGPLARAVAGGST